MIRLVDIRYVRMGTGDLEAAIAYGRNILGLELVRRGDGAAYLRGDDRDHNICYFTGDPKDHTLGLEIDSAASLDAAAVTLQAAGVAVTRGTAEGAAARRALDYINFRDPTGNSVDIVLRPYHSGKRYFPSRDAGIQEFSHVGLRTSGRTA